jgi:nitrogen regulatory protein PII-like uncharacterized protein
MNATVLLKTKDDEKCEKRLKDLKNSSAYIISYHKTDGLKLPADRLSMLKNVKADASNWVIDVKVDTEGDIQKIESELKEKLNADVQNVRLIA